MNRSPHNPASSPSSIGLHLFAILTSVCTLPLIFLGGLVTSHDVALAVPDWPTSFGYNMFLFPWQKMVGGIFYEHSHRLVGSWVGMLTLILTFWIYFKEKRSWVRKLGATALVAVVFQGILGGLRVILVFKPIAIFHACLAQGFFCLIAAIALFTSPFWRKLDLGTFPAIKDVVLKKLALITTLVIIGQLILGSIMRHTQSGLAIPDFPQMYGHWLPPLGSTALEHANDDRIWVWNLEPVSLAQVLIHLSHRIWAFVVVFFVFTLFARIRNHHSDNKILMNFARLLLALIFIQFALGISVIWSQKAADIATAHVAVGALILVSSFLLTVISFKWVAPPLSSGSISVASEQAVA